MGSIKKCGDFIQLTLGAQELVQMPFRMAPGEWNVGGAIARACAEKVQEKSKDHPELAGLDFDMYRVSAQESGGYRVELRIKKK